MISVWVKPLTDEPEAILFTVADLPAARTFAANELAEWLEASMDPGNGATGEACDGPEVARIACDYAEAIVQVLAWDGEQPITVAGGFREELRLEARA